MEEWDWLRKYMKQKERSKKKGRPSKSLVQLVIKIRESNGNDGICYRSEGMERMVTLLH